MMEQSVCGGDGISADLHTAAAAAAASVSASSHANSVLDSSNDMFANANGQFSFSSSSSTSDFGQQFQQHQPQQQQHPNQPYQYNQYQHSSHLASSPQPLQLPRPPTPPLIDIERLRTLEQEQEQLNSSLMSLTTHFAQVQFRLKQIIAAPSEQREELLKGLEEFAFRGCPNLSHTDIQSSLAALAHDTTDTDAAALPTQSQSQSAQSDQPQTPHTPSSSSTLPHQTIIEKQRVKQRQLIDKLKEQLQDLESYAYQSGNLDLPSTLVMEKQKIIIDELREKINLPFDNLNKLSNDQLKEAVDAAIFQIMNPVKLKEQLVTQLKTQIVDLERFIQFLQGEASSPGPYAKQNGMGDEAASSSAFPVFDQPKKNTSNKAAKSGGGGGDEAKGHMETANQTTIELLKKVLSVMQMFALTQLGCGVKSSFEKNTLKKSANHWGDLRANLEVSVNKVLKINSNIVAMHRMKSLKLNSTSPTTESDNDDDDDESKQAECPNELIRAVRKDLACSLRDLLQHGLVESTQGAGAGSSLIPFGCFVVRSKESSQSQLHAWDLLLKYYGMKHGKEFTQSAVNKLSQSFSLTVVAGRPITTKQSLLSSIETVHRVHKYDTSNKDSCFKAFVCMALNEKKLVAYLKQLLKSTLIIENCYQSWSYVKSTGFDDALKTLDQLKMLYPTLPVDKSMRRKSANKDLFYQ